MTCVTPALEASSTPRVLRMGRPAALLAAGLVVAAWLLTTPPGLLGKADAVGYAVCHRIDLRSFHIGERTLPLCARCTGIYLGAVLTLGGFQLTSRGRRGAFPGGAVLGAFVLFGAAFTVDGVNSYLSLFPGLPHLYEPANELRLITGLLAGIAVGTFVHAGFHQNAWKEWRPEPALQNVRGLAVLLGAAALVAGVVLSENALLLYPLALISAAGVLLVLTSVYSVLVLLVLGRENKAASWAELRLPAALGLALAIAQVGAIDFVRFALTGTWAGFRF
jgi:uncharacterized membrane protein